MLRNTFVRYVGADDALFSDLQNLCRSAGCGCQRFATADELLARMSGSVEASQALRIGRGRFADLDEDVSPLVLDLGLSAEDTSEVIREIKSRFGGIAIIVVSETPSLSFVSLVRLDGVEAFFAKPLLSLAPLQTAIEQTLRKLDNRWFHAIEKAQRHAQASSPVQAASASE